MILALREAREAIVVTAVAFADATIAVVMADHAENAAASAAHGMIVANVVDLADHAENAAASAAHGMIV
ncbi:MAG: hypothetical protein ACKPEY_11845, partial [Planctomycetota bacterium]